MQRAPTGGAACPPHLLLTRCKFRYSTCMLVAAHAGYVTIDAGGACGTLPSCMPHPTLLPVAISDMQRACRHAGMQVAARAGYVAIDQVALAAHCPAACLPPPRPTRCIFRYSTCSQAAARAGYVAFDAGGACGTLPSCIPLALPLSPDAISAMQRACRLQPAPAMQGLPRYVRR